MATKRKSETEDTAADTETIASWTEDGREHYGAKGGPAHLAAERAESEGKGRAADASASDH